MRRGSFVAVLALLAWAGPADACDVSVSQTSGQAPLAVTYTALCTSTVYHWTFSDGATADGATVTHTFAPGRWSATLATDAATDSAAPVTSRALTLAIPRRGRWGYPLTLTGTVKPVAPVRIYRGDAYVTTARAGTGGRFQTTLKLLGPGPYTARVADVTSAEVSTVVQPVLEARIVGTPTVGGALGVVATLRPAQAGSLRVRAGTKTKSGRTVRLRLDTTKPRKLVVRVATVAARGYAAPSQTLEVPIAFPDLGYGDSGPSVLELQRRLAELGYASLGADGSFDGDTVDAVTAFQKVERLERTGRADADVWQRLAEARTPQPRYAGGGSHVEVDKTRQVLFLVRGGRVELIVPVSTAGIAGYSTPEGRFAVYRKVAGLDRSPLGVLYDPSYFVGGYAIHGSPSVPPYPASHGCVRVPMWISWRLHTTLPYGEPVYVYS